MDAMDMMGLVRVMMLLQANKCEGALSEHTNVVLATKWNHVSHCATDGQNCAISSGLRCHPST